LFTSSDYNEFISAAYEPDNNAIEIESTIHDQDEYGGFYFSLIFNSNVIGASFENNQFNNINDYSFMIIETLSLNDKVWEEVLSIKINEDSRRGELSEIWI